MPVEDKRLNPRESERLAALFARYTIAILSGAVRAERSRARAGTRMLAGEAPQVSAVIKAFAAGLGFGHNGSG